MGFISCFESDLMEGREMGWAGEYGSGNERKGERRIAA